MKNNNIFLKKVIFILSNLGIKESFKVIMKNIFSYNHYYILNANLKSIKLFQKTRIKYSLKKIEENEISEIREMLPSLSPKDRKEILIRLSFYNSGFKNCYIARSKKGKIAYIQWIIYPHENEIIEKHFWNRFRPLNKNQVLVENSFTSPEFRGLGLLPDVIVNILNMAKEEGYRHAITYIRKDIFVTLNEFIRMGFKIQKIIREFKLLGFTKRML